MTGWLQLFLDTPSAEFEQAVAFWTAATGWEPSPRRGENGQFLTLVPPAGPAWVKMQAVDGPGGVHLDLDSSDRPGAVARAAALGARHAWTYEGVEVMHSPGGLLHCHTLDVPDSPLSRTGETILDQVCIDVPSHRWDAETTFWAQMTDRPLVVLDESYARLDAPGQPRILLQRLGEAEGAVRAHPDLAVADRVAETDRHTALGADVVALHDTWTVLRAPGGQVYCLTDRDPATGLHR